MVILLQYQWLTIVMVKGVAPGATMEIKEGFETMKGEMVVEVV